MIETNTSTSASGENKIRARAAEAEKIASLSRVMRGSRSFNIDLGGAELRRDTVAIASAARLYAEADSQRAARSNASQAVSLLQTADAALAETAARLERMQTLASEVTSAGNSLSNQDRQAYQQELDSLRNDIDDIAEDAEFNGVALLQGGETPGSALTYDIAVSPGPGGETVSISIGPATVSDLSATLDTASLQTAADATAAATSIDEAINNLGSLRAEIAADTRTLAAAIQQSELTGAASTEHADRRTEVQVNIDFSRLISEQIVKEADIQITDPQVELMRIGLRIAHADRPAAPLAPSSNPAPDLSPPTETGFSPVADTDFPPDPDS